MIEGTALGTERWLVPWFLPKSGVHPIDGHCRVSIDWQQLRTNELKPPQWRAADTCVLLIDHNGGILRVSELQPATARPPLISLSLYVFSSQGCQMLCNACMLRPSVVLLLSALQMLGWGNYFDDICLMSSRMIVSIAQRNFHAFAKYFSQAVFDRWSRPAVTKYIDKLGFTGAMIPTDATCVPRKITPYYTKQLHDTRAWRRSL